MIHFWTSSSLIKFPIKWFLLLVLRFCICTKVLHNSQNQHLRLVRDNFLYIFNGWLSIEQKIQFESNFYDLDWSLIHLKDWGEMKPHPSLLIILSFLLMSITSLSTNKNNFVQEEDKVLESLKDMLMVDLGSPSNKWMCRVFI